MRTAKSGQASLPGGAPRASRLSDVVSNVCSTLWPQDGVIGRNTLISDDCEKMRFRLMFARDQGIGAPNIKQGEAQHGTVCRSGRIESRRRASVLWSGTGKIVR